MENTAKGLTTRDTILLIVEAAGGEVRGRTAMQKLAYFSALELEASFGHRAHYYGPYSSRVEDAVNLSVVAGDLDEEVRRFPAWYGGDPDVRQHSYRLTEQGSEKAKQQSEAHPEEAERIRGAVEAIKKVVPDFNQKTLSSAAKTYLIVSESDEPVSEADIPGLARHLGWQLTQAEVKKTIQILEDLRLLEVERSH